MMTTKHYNPLDEAWATTLHIDEKITEMKAHIAALMQKNIGSPGAEAELAVMSDNFDDFQRMIEETKTSLKDC